MSRKIVAIMMMSFITMVTVSFAAASDPNKSIDLTIGLSGLDEDSRSKSREYRDIDEFQFVLPEFHLLNFGEDNTFRYSMAMENPGYEDMSVGLYAQYKKTFIVSTSFEQIPHYIDGMYGTQRDVYNTKFVLYPLSRVSAQLSYYYEENDGTISSVKVVDQKNDEIKLELSAGSSSVSGVLALSDSKMEHPYAGYDSDGISLTLASEENGNLLQSLILNKKEYSSNRATLLPGELETMSAIYNARYELREYFHINLAMTSVETNNSNSSTMEFDRETYRIGAVLKTSYFRMGYNYLDTEVEYKNAEVENKSTDSHEIFFKGEPWQNLKLRASYKTENRSTVGVSTLALSNTEQLASKKNTGVFNATLLPCDKVTLTADLIAKDEKYETVSTTGLDKQNFHSRILGYNYQYNPKITLYGNYYYQKSLFNGIFKQSVGGGFVYPVYRIGQDSATYLSGLSFQTFSNIAVDFSYSQGRSKIGDYLRTNQISERNIILTFNRKVGKDTDVELSLERNSYNDRLESGISGNSDLVQIAISKKINF